MMASRQVLLFATLAVACLPALASATEWMVGDSGGWRLKFNETNWTEGKTFRVGDTLRFMYAMGKHTVIEVGGADFRACNLQANQLGSWKTGDDIVNLDNASRRWFICDVPDHCDQGMKMLVNVIEAGGAPAPSAPAPSAPAPSAEPPSNSSAPVAFSLSGAVAAAAGAVVAAALAF